MKNTTTNIIETIAFSHNNCILDIIAFILATILSVFIAILTSSVLPNMIISTTIAMMSMMILLVSSAIISSKIQDACFKICIKKEHEEKQKEIEKIQDIRNKIETEINHFRTNRYEYIYKYNNVRWKLTKFKDIENAYYIVADYIWFERAYSNKYFTLKHIESVYNAIRYFNNNISNEKEMYEINETIKMFHY